MSTNPAFRTPTLTVRSNRGLAIRRLAYNRQSAEDSLDERIARTMYDPLDRVACRIDPRLFTAASAPNFTYQSSLSGRVLRTDSVDAGTTWTLADAEGRPAWSRDARGTTTTWTYDVLGRPLTADEVAGSQTPATRDVWIYGEDAPDAQAHNLRGRCVRRYDTAGRLAWSGFTLPGQPLAETRQLLADAEADADWAGQDEAAWTSALDKTQYLSAWQHDATGTWVTQTDAKGNVQQRGFDVAGRLVSSTLTLAGGKPKPVLSAIAFNAAGQVLSETAGNGTISSYTYEPETRRLIGLNVTRPAQTGRATVVQDLSYTYDPVGNALSVSDAAQATRYWRNNKVEPACTYDYDALYQLVTATGRETANRGQQGHTLPQATVPLPSDDTVYTNYSRTYAYDRGGNLTAIRHQGAVNYTQPIVVSDRSNHAVLQNATAQLKPPDIDDGTWFDALGNQQSLLPDRLQPLTWNTRNQLKQVTLLKRNGPDDDREAYQYGADGMRVRKRKRAESGNVTHTVEIIYLPGLTLTVTASDDGHTVKVVEALQEIISTPGNIRARCLHWDTGKPDDIGNDLTRYGIKDRTGSIGLEFDDQADMISREEYYPFGGTAVWAARSQVEADTKFVRYSSKERDATGLYDYGYRYYQPWIGRWLNTDPARTVDGLNLYRMVRNNPITLVDGNGLVSEKEVTGKEPSPKYAVPDNGGYPHVLFMNMRSDSAAQSSSRYNAAIAYQGSLAYRLTGDMVVNVELPGTLKWPDTQRKGRQFNIANSIRAAINKWGTALGDVPLTIGEAETEKEPNFPIRVAPIAGSATVIAVTFASRADWLEGDRQAGMDFNKTVSLSVGSYYKMKSLSENNNPDEWLDRFYYATALHEFGHALGLAHPQGEAHVRTAEPTALTTPDKYQVADENIFTFLQAVQQSNNGEPLTLERINPSEGEIEALRKSMRPR